MSKPYPIAAPSGAAASLPAADIPRESAPLRTHHAVYALLRQYCPAGTVVDAPSGSGAFTQRLVEAPEYTARPLDIAHPPHLPRGERGAAVIADMDAALPYATGSMDAVVSIEGIEHIRRPWDFVRECARVVRPGGWLILSTPNVSSVRSRWRWFWTGFHHKAKYPLDEANPQPRHHINMRAFPELRYMLHTSGFVLEAVATNRIKPVSWLFLPCVPLMWLGVSVAMRRGAKNATHRRQIREVIRQMMRPSVLFGETLILVARRGAGPAS